jgi:hypothetical protein
MPQASELKDGMKFTHPMFQTVVTVTSVEVPGGEWIIVHFTPGQGAKKVTIVYLKTTTKVRVHP